MKQGEIWIINLSPTTGAEIKKTRPGIIVNNSALGKLPLRIIVPLTDWKDRYQAAPWMIKSPLTNPITLKRTLRLTVFKFGLFHRKDL